MEKLSIILLNFNGRSHLETYLPSVVSNSGEHTIYMVDNGSTDDSVVYVKKKYPSIKIIEFEENYGFCGGYNKALQLVMSEFVVLLNTDVEVSPDWIPPILKLLESDSETKAVQPKILDHKNKDRFEYAGASGGFVDTMGYPFCRGRIFETLEKDENQYQNEREVFWASGSCLFVHRDTYLSLGGLDEDFFAHMEEIDLCWRIWNAGYKVKVCPDSIVFHLGGGTLDKSKPKKTYLNFRNGLSLILKNESLFKLLWKFPLRLILDWAAILKFSLQSGPQHGVAILHAHFSTLLKLPVTIAKRKHINRKGGNIPRFRGFITWEYFIKGKKKFKELEH